MCSLQVGSKVGWYLDEDSDDEEPLQVRYPD